MWKRRYLCFELLLPALVDLDEWHNFTQSTGGDFKSQILSRARNSRPQHLTQHFHARRIAKSVQKSFCEAFEVKKHKDSALPFQNYVPIPKKIIYE
jgi:hypothetical protein